MTTIALNKLVPAKANVRRTGATDGIEELAASIAAHGLLTSLTVRKSARGKFAVIAGRRRYLALSLLADRDQLPADHPVLCQVLDRDADATEIGLAENVVRLAMHPADQFEAFRDLIDKGAGIADIAARFGVAETTVTKRLKLGRVSPAILDAYRAGQLGLEQVQAFAVSDDTQAQDRVFASIGVGHRANRIAIRRALTEGEIPSTDPRLRFIGLDAYEAAGGPARRDLFDQEDSGYAQDPALLDSLVTDKLAAIAETVRAEGWSWAEAQVQFGYEERGRFGRCFPEDVALPEDEAAELARLQAAHDELLEAQYDEEGEDDPAVTEQLEALGDRINALEARARAWTPEQMAGAGAIVALSSDGEPEVHRGLIRLEDAEAEPDAADEEHPCPAPSLPATLTEALTSRRTAALRATLAQQPDVALAAVTHALARQAFYTYGGETCLNLLLRQRLLKDDGDCGGSFAFDAERGKWTDRLPADADDLWAWCISQTQDTLLDLLAVSSAHAIDVVRVKGTPEDAPRLLHADALTKALQLDMSAWFRPTAENYFGRVSRTLIMEAMTQAGLPVRTRLWSKMKKVDLAVLAEREMAETGWLPQPLRPVAQAVPFDWEQTGMQVAAAA